MTRMSLAERRQKLIEAALAVIGRDGAGAATTRAIAAEAGMPLASFHYAFESHRMLMVEALKVLVAEELARLDELVPQDEAPAQGGSEAERVADLLRRHLDDVQQRTRRHLTVLELQDHVARLDDELGLPSHFREQRVLRVARLLAAGGGGQDAAEPGAQGLALADAVVTMADGLTLGFLASRDVASGERAIAHWTQTPLAG